MTEAYVDKTGTDQKPNPMRDVFLEFPRTMMALATVTAFGAKKHAPRGWQTFDPKYGLEYHMGKAGRHTLALETEGLINHTDGGLRHRVQAAWNYLAACENELKLAEAEAEGKTAAMLVGGPYPKADTLLSEMPLEQRNQALADASKSDSEAPDRLPKFAPTTVMEPVPRLNPWREKSVPKKRILPAGWGGATFAMTPDEDGDGGDVMAVQSPGETAYVLVDDRWFLPHITPRTKLPEGWLWIWWPGIQEWVVERADISGQKTEPRPA